jgi:uncharacterized protein YdhG (YjbR/CyaY superfamily)
VPAFPNIGQPALRALTAYGVKSMKSLTDHTESEILKLHGMGPKALGILKLELSKSGLAFKTAETSRQVDEYLSRLPGKAKSKLAQIRALVRQVVDGGEEVISYGVPTVRRGGKYVIYFAGYKTHVSLHPIPPGDAKFQKLIKPYVAGKGTLRFGLEQPLPLKVINTVIKQCLRHNQQRTSA